MGYIYNIEDGQFSRQIYSENLEGSSGDIVQLEDNGFKIDVYILLVEGNCVLCLGNIEGVFPKNLKEHNEYLNLMAPKNEEENEYMISFFNSDYTLNDTPIVIEAKSKAEAEIIFRIDYPETQIYKIQLSN